MVERWSIRTVIYLTNVQRLYLGEMRKELKELEKRVDELENHVIRAKDADNKHRVELRWKPLTPEEQRRLEKQAKPLVSSLRRLRNLSANNYIHCKHQVEMSKEINEAKGEAKPKEDIYASTRS